MSKTITDKRDSQERNNITAALVGIRGLALFGSKWAWQLLSTIAQNSPRDEMMVKHEC